MVDSRETWSSKFGFVMAAVGSAVGLGNMWRFSYLTAEYGGAAFLALYVLMTLVVGIPVMTAEFAVGRAARRGPVVAMERLGGRRWRALGALFVATGFLILAYYSVVSGWTVRYVVDTLVFGLAEDPGSRFGAISQGHGSALWHLLFMALTTAIVARGIRGGIERVALFVMPALFLLVVGIAIYAATLPGAEDGYRYYLHTDFAALFRIDVLTAAAGQAFFSLSLGMGALLTYASYLGRDNHLPGQAATIALADFGVAFLAGLMVFPLIFALGLSGQVIGTAGTDSDVGTIGALFVTLPEAFLSMGAGGRWLGVLFFVALAVGALTSAISLLEVTVAASLDALGWSRRRAAVVLGLAIALVGLLPAYRIAVLGWMDQLAGNLFLVGGGMALAIFVGYRMQDPIAALRDGAPRFPEAALRIWRALLRVPVPLILAVVLFYALRDLFAG